MPGTSRQFADPSRILENGLVLEKLVDGVIVPRELLVRLDVVYVRVACAAQPGDILQVLLAVPASLDSLVVDKARDEVVVRQGRPLALAELALGHLGARRAGRRFGERGDVVRQRRDQEGFRAGGQGGGGGGRRRRRKVVRVRGDEAVRGQRLAHGVGEVDGRGEGVGGDGQRELRLEGLGRLPPGAVGEELELRGQGGEDLGGEVLGEVGELLDVAGVPGLLGRGGRVVALPPPGLVLVLLLLLLAAAAAPGRGGGLLLLLPPALG